MVCQQVFHDGDALHGWLDAVLREAVYGRSVATIAHVIIVLILFRCKIGNKYILVQVVWSFFVD